MGGQRKALIVASDTYEQEALSNLTAPAADAEALERVLNDPQIGDFAVQVVRNEPSHVIQVQIEEMFSESRPDDVLLLHFSGHGLKSDSGELFFAAANTRPNLLGATAVSADFVQRCMRTCRSRSVVLLLDCCYGGAFAQGVKVRAGGDVNVLDSFPRGTTGGGRGRAVITASSAMEFAFEGNQIGDDQQRQPSVFTTALVEGLATGEADRDEDGWVSMDELYDYVFDKVREQNPHQTPSRQFELEGELYLARSRRRRIPPAPIPPDLQKELTNPNIYARLGVVSELRSRLASEVIPAAAGAYEALAQLASSDISYVAGSAADALQEAAVRPAERELHFGRVEQGSASPHRTVQLLGPPVARACDLRPSHRWIRAELTAGRLDISIDTNGLGELRGSLGLKGPTGEAVIAIDIDLVAPAVQPLPEPPPRPEQPRITRPPAVTPLVPSSAPPPIRSGAARAGLWVALFAGAAGLSSNFFSYPAPVPRAFIFFKQALYVVPVVVAVTGLVLRNHRRMLIGLLQGLWWPSVAWLAWDPVSLATHEFTFTTGGDYLGLGSGVLGVIAVILLVGSWNPGEGRSRGQRRSALPLALVYTVSLSQLAGVFLYTDVGFERRHYAYYAVGVVAVIAGLAVGWYATGLPNPFLGGLVLIGWTVSVTISLIATVLLVVELKHESLAGVPRYAVIAEFVLLAAGLILAAVHMRSPDRLERGASGPDRSR